MAAKAFLSLNFEITSFLIQSYRDGRDRVFLGLYKGQFKCLIIISLACFLFSPKAKSQKTNELVYNQLLGEYLSSKSRWKELSGFRTDYVDSLAKVDSTQKTSLSLANPEIQFLKGSNQKYLRTVSILVSTSDGEDKLLSSSDSLSLKEIQKVRKSKYTELKGEHPSALRKFLLPAAAIVGGISGIISLFYIRSR